MFISHLFLIFIASSFCGWIFECVYCTVKTTRWQNRGFLFGPICPIYGLGFTGALLLYSGGTIPGNSAASFFLAPFFFCALGSAVLEYSVSFLLEKLFYARWWDYSDMPLNLNGRICLPASCLFGTTGFVFIRYVFPFLDSHVPAMRIGIGGPVEELSALLLMGFLGVDLGLSISNITGLLDTLARIQSEFDEAMENRYEPIGSTQRVLAGKITDAGHAVAGKLEGAGQTVAGRIGDAGSSVAGRIGTVGQTMAERFESVQDSMAEKIEGASEYMDVLRRQTGRLTRRQIGTLLNIEAFAPTRYKGAAEKLKALFLRRSQEGEDSSAKTGEDSENERKK